ncbi:hypothetical protein FCV25MIE_04126 [Fagus crenata]
MHLLQSASKDFESELWLAKDWLSHTGTSATAPTPIENERRVLLAALNDEFVPRISDGQGRSGPQLHLFH